MRKFDGKNERLASQFANIRWQGGLDEKTLAERFDTLMKNEAGLSRAMIKAETYALLAEFAPIAVDEEDIFQDKLFGGNFLGKQRGAWERAVIDAHLAEEAAARHEGWQCGAYNANGDYGHTSPNSRLLVDVGAVGLFHRVEQAAMREGLTERQKDFYHASAVTLRAFLRYLARLADAVEPYDRENAAALRNLAEAAPANSYEAMQLLVAYFFFHEYVGKTRVRTLGRLDVLLDPFFKRDIARGTYTQTELREMLKFFLHKFWAAKVPFDLPFCLGGVDAEGNDVTSDTTRLIIDTYNELNIHSPKIHIRVSEKSPPDLLKQVLSCIRGGNSSFVFVNDEVAIRALTGVGIERGDALDYVPIGCYEPAVWGVEIGCTGNGGVNLAKAVELVVTRGIDHATGARLGLDTGRIDSFDGFVDAVKRQIVHLTERAVSFIVGIEKHYGEINPDPLLSAMYDHSVAAGVDVYEGGAKYNNSSLYYWCIASLVDSVAAVKKLVFEDGDVTFDELCDILKNNWEAHEALRAKALRFCEKYGNGSELADSLAVEFSNFVSEISNNRPNGRGGVFKTALFSIDHYVPLGQRTMATPDGRRAGEILSKNLCATVGMDRNGITALIRSVTKMELSRFPTGSVLDILLHPSAVAGEDGLDAFLGILLAYFRRGGFAMHGNVFCAEDLRAAQKEPEKYKNLQVRVCGWNVFFVNLSKTEQDAFIRQAEGVM